MEALTRRAGRPDLDEASRVLGDAFVHSPWITWTVQEERRLLRVVELQRCALELLGYPYGQVWVTTVGGTIASVAVLMDTAIEIPPAIEEQCRANAAEFEGTRNQASIEAEDVVQSLRPTTHHYVLATIGTRPGLQGRGLGTRTLTTALDSREVAAVDTYLETSTRQNVEFYERFGFSVTGYRRIATDGPDVWAMVRTA